MSSEHQVEVSQREHDAPLRALLLYGALPVLAMAAVFTVVGAHSSRHEARYHAPPMQVGPLRIHGPLKVRGSVQVDGELRVHGPLAAYQIDRTQGPGSYAQQPHVLDFKIINGPFSLKSPLHVNGDLEVDGPMDVRGQLLTAGTIRADGPVSERNR